LTRLFEDVEGWVHIFALDRATGERHIVCRPTSDITGLVLATRPFVDSSCVWYGVSPRRENPGPGRRGESDDCSGIVALWLDIDVQGPGHSSPDLPPTKAAGR